MNLIAISLDGNKNKCQKKRKENNFNDTRCTISYNLHGNFNENTQLTAKENVSTQILTLSQSLPL